MFIYIHVLVNFMIYKLIYPGIYLLDFEWSDKCIIFTYMCVFRHFVSPLLGDVNL